MPNNPPPRVVVIDDDRDHLTYLTDLLRGAGYDVTGFHDAAAAMRMLGRDGANLVVTDIFMPDMDGFEVLRNLRDIDASIPVIAVSLTRTEDERLFLQSIKRMGAVDSLARPIDAAAMLAAVAGALRKR